MSAVPVGNPPIPSKVPCTRRPTRCLTPLPRAATFSRHYSLVESPASSSFRVCSTSSDAEASTSERSAETAEQPAPPPTFLPPPLLRRIAAAANANEALDILSEDPTLTSLSDLECRTIMAVALDRGNVDLAQSIFRAMSVAANTKNSSSSALLSPHNNTTTTDTTTTTAVTHHLSWPPATTETAVTLVIGLCRSLRTKEAVAVIETVRCRGLPVGNEEVQFGFVVESPLTGAGKPLTLMQPQEGIRSVVDSYSKYEYELFSGTVTAAVSSESLVAESSTWLSTTLGSFITGNTFAQRWGLLWRPSATAVHTAVVETPAGQQRTFRFGTATADVPVRQGDRVTMVCAPQSVTNKQMYGLVSAAPPETKPGEPLAVTNHTLSVSTQLARPPQAGMPGGLPNWVIPAVAALVAADAASSLVNPVLPYMVAGGVLSTAATTVAARKIALPRLKQLPLEKLEIQATRQKLLGQHTALQKRMTALVKECEEDVRVLARLWQLQAKMGAVGGGSNTYDARLTRVSEARVGIEGRLRKRVEMVDAYSQVISMIEIEVEIETQVPAAEVESIEVQIVRLGEIEELQAEWTLQAEAQDEVERLLRTVA